VTFYSCNWVKMSTPPYDNSILFAGYYRDEETGLYYVRNRTYHPALGRWMQRDPAGYEDGMSLYEYVGSNAGGAIDPSGMSMTLVVPGRPWWANLVAAAVRERDYGYPFMTHDEAKEEAVRLLKEDIKKKNEAAKFAAEKAQKLARYVMIMRAHWRHINGVERPDVLRTSRMAAPWANTRLELLAARLVFRDKATVSMIDPPYFKTVYTDTYAIRTKQTSYPVYSAYAGVRATGFIFCVTGNRKNRIWRLVGWDGRLAHAFVKYSLKEDKPKVSITTGAAAVKTWNAVQLPPYDDSSWGEWPDEQPKPPVPPVMMN